MQLDPMFSSKLFIIATGIVPLIVESRIDHVKL